jgi:hypothetical protein
MIRLRKILPSFAKFLFAVVPSALGVLFTGCVQFQKPMQSSDMPPANMAIIYGRFESDKPNLFGDKLGMRLLNVKTKRQYLISFRTTNSVYGIAIVPGRYRIDGCIGSQFHYFAGPKLSFLETPDIDCRPDTVIYIGDFKSAAHQQQSGAWDWGVFGFTNNYLQTTKEFQTKHEEFRLSPFASARLKRSKRWK